MTRLALFGALVALSTSFAFAGCGRINDKDSESHFLEPCTASCAAGLECLCGVCTRSCTGTAECSAIDERALCVSTPGSWECSARAAKTCDLTCVSDNECSLAHAGQKCIEGRCRLGGAPMDAALDGRAGSGGAAGGASASGGSGGIAGDASASGGSGGGAGIQDAGTSGPCSLDDAWFAMMTEIPVEYGQQPGMWAAAFTGKLRLLTLAHAHTGAASDAGSMLPMDLRVCGMQIPDFTIPDPMAVQLGAMEVYGVTFPNAVWDNWNPDPTYAMTGTISSVSSLPGNYVSLSELALPLGAWSFGALDIADWPSLAGTDYAKLINGTFDPWEQVDMDQDGHPGITGVAKTGPIPADSDVHNAQSSDPSLLAKIDAVTTYSLPLGDTTTNMERASEIYFGLRAIINATQQYAAILQPCDLLEGTSTVRAVQHHVVGCWQGSGAGAPESCPTLMTATLDSWIPQFTVGSASFLAKRLPNPPTALMASTACTPARQAFPAQFPP